MEPLRIYIYIVNYNDNNVDDLRIERGYRTNKSHVGEYSPRSSLVGNAKE